MTRFWMLRTGGLAIAIGLALSAQEPPAGGAGQPGAGGAGGGGIPGGGANVPGGGGLPGGGGGRGGQQGQQQPGLPGQDQRGQNPFPSMDMQRPLFLSGKVMTSDGTPPPESVTIELLCNGSNPRPQAYTDSKGRFSFQVGQNQGMMADASVSNNDPFGNDPFNSGGRGRSQGGLGGQGRGISERDLMGCELRAALPGWRSENVNLSGRRFMDNPDIGTIMLKRLGNVEGLTTSATALMAPKEAKKSYERAMNNMKKGKPADIQKDLEKAVELYPKYAPAWFELGRIHERGNNVEGAKKAYTEALSSDLKFVYPYMQLAGLSARESKWDEVADSTERLIKLNPYDFPAAYFYNAVANLNLKKLDLAEKSAAAGLKADEFKKIPKLNHVMGVIAAQKQDFPTAAEYMKTYLKLSPLASDADFVKKQLAEVEGLAAENKAK